MTRPMKVEKCVEILQKPANDWCANVTFNECVESTDHYQHIQ